MKNTKRIFALVMVVALMLALSMSAFATDTVTLYINGVSQGSFNIGTDTTVYDIVSQLSTAVWSSEYSADPSYSPLNDTNSPLHDKYNGKVCYLTSLNGVGSEAYVPVAGAVDVNGEYISNQTVDANLQEADAMLTSYGGLKYWDGNGYGYNSTRTHGVYIGSDWVFTVNSSTPGYYPIPGYYFQYTMRESLLANADRIDLNYQEFFFVF
jgi:hypothetical protein